MNLIWLQSDSDTFPIISFISLEDISSNHIGTLKIRFFHTKQQNTIPYVIIQNPPEKSSTLLSVCSLPYEHSVSYLWHDLQKSPYNPYFLTQKKWGCIKRYISISEVGSLFEPYDIRSSNLAWRIWKS